MSTLTVQTPQAPTSGANANKLLVGSGHTLHAAGHIIQVVNGVLTAGAANSTTSYVDTGLTATITPKFATSKILVVTTIMGVENNTASEGTHVKLVRGSTDLSEFGKYMGYVRTYVTNHPSISFLDSPSTTSATTYKVQFKLGQGSGTSNIGANSSISSMTLMEIAQ